MNQTLRFQVTGEWFTQFLRDRYFGAGIGYEKAMQAALAGMSGTDTPEGALKRMAQDILLGRAEMVGNTADGSYAYRDTGAAPTTVFDHIDRLTRELEHEKAMRLDADRRWSDLAESVMNKTPLWECEYEANRALGPEEIVALQDALPERGRWEYGMLSPTGEFHPIPWGEHEGWAGRYLREHHLEAAYDVDRAHTALDFMIYKLGWLLLHNPRLGRPVETRDEQRRMPNRQRDGLYAYYIKAGLMTEADRVFKEADR